MPYMRFNNMSVCIFCERYNNITSYIIYSMYIIEYAL